MGRTPSLITSYGNFSLPPAGNQGKRSKLANWGFIERCAPNVLRRELLAHESRLPVVAFRSLAAQPSISKFFRLQFRL